ncbi:MAG TPA: hypothetical protein VLI54_01170 [Bacillota bacterium]|nr:hypothetical protein [Bacillota bacterium]
MSKRAPVSTAGAPAPDDQAQLRAVRAMHPWRLKRQRLKAHWHARLLPAFGQSISNDNPRHATLSLGRTDSLDTPLFSFLLNKSLVDKIEAATAKKKSRLTEAELLDIALATTEDAAQEQFSAQALNAVAASYYASPVAFAAESLLANMYAANITLNYTLGALMAAESGHKGTMRVKELASGAKTDHWQFMAEGMRHQGARHMDVVLTDFVPLKLDPQLSTFYSDLTVSTEVYSLFDDLAPLPKTKRFDAFFTSYAFDSVWQPEDMRLSRVGNNWYRSSYRLKVADWNKRKEELLLALRHGRALPHARPQDYKGIFVEEIRQKVDVHSLPYGDIIARHGRAVLNVPGGAVKRIVNAFAAQLASHGVFVIGDVMHITPSAQPRHSEVAGVAARFKVEDYDLLKQILEERHGLTAKMVTFPELAQRFLPDGWRLQVPQFELEQMNGQYGNRLMVITRRGSDAGHMG